MAMISRRATLWALGGMIAAGATASRIACGRMTRDAALRFDRLDVALADLPGAARIGYAVRKETARSDLIRQFLDRPLLVTALELDCPSSRLAVLRSQIRNDFETDDIIIADRWIVARSEGLISALYPTETFA